MELVSGSHSLGQNLYHFERYPKYRHKTFRKEKNKKLCKEVLREVAEKHGMGILELSVISDYVHAIVSIPST
jgi:REP element-mobilizing transposase RayT